MAGLVILAVHPGRKKRAILATEVIAEKNNINKRTHSGHPFFQVLQVDGAELFREPDNRFRIKGHICEVIVHSIQPLRQLKHIAAEQANDSPVRGFPQGFGFTGHFCQPLLIQRQMRTRMRCTCPYGMAHHILQIGKIVAGDVPLYKRKMNLLEVEASVFLYGQFTSVIGQQIPPIRSFFNIDVIRNFARRAIRQYPVLPAALFEQKTPAQLDSICAETIQHILIDDSQLLYHIINTNRFWRQVQKLSQLRVCNCSDAGRPVPGKVNGDTVRLTVVQCG